MIDALPCRQEQGALMAAFATRPDRNGIVLVVGLDLDDTSEDLLSAVRELTRGKAHAELHVVHVVPARASDAPFGEPVSSLGLAERRRAQIAQWEIERLCQAVLGGTETHVVVHTPAVQPVAALAELSREV